MSELLTRTLHDMALLLESVQDSEARLLRVLELLGKLVPYERCALFEAQPGREPRLRVLPATPPDIQTKLSETCERLRRQLVDESARRFEALPAEPGMHLAVLLVNPPDAIGLLYLSREARDGSAVPYTDQHLRELSIVGAHLAGYVARVGQATALAYARQEAASAKRTRDELLAMLSLELKAPLASTLAWARALASEQAKPAARADALRGIERNALAQAALSDEIIDLASVVGPDRRLDFEAVEAASLVEAAVAQQRARAERKSIRIETALDESIRRLVVDRMRIVQVVSNVLANVIRLAPSGARIGVHLDRNGACARISVCEYGRQRLAVPAVSGRVDPARAGKTSVADPRIGRAFAIAETLVEAHGGSMRAEPPDEEKPSAVVIELPLPFVPPPPCDRSLIGVHVLLVDDNEDLRSAVEAVLVHEGAEVKGVASAAAALAVVESAWPHVLLSDLSLPGESGYDLMREIALRHAMLPSAAFTALGTEEERRRTRAAGFRMHLTKPLELRALVTAVAILAGRPPGLPEWGGVGRADRARESS